MQLGHSRRSDFGAPQNMMISGGASACPKMRTGRQSGDVDMFAVHHSSRGCSTDVDAVRGGMSEDLRVPVDFAIRDIMCDDVVV